MKLALIGYGKMGRLVEQVAQERGHQVVAKLSSGNLQMDQLKEAEICIDFSVPTAVMQNVEILAKAKKSIVMGTTGWHEHYDQIAAIVNQYQIGFLHSANFSIGVNLFLQIVQAAATLMNDHDEYDVAMSEMHHKGKLDSPSGTAEAIAKILLERIKRKKRVQIDPLNGKIEPEMLQIASMRCGGIPGTHTVIFDSAADTITLSHQARNREGFARGAVKAAEWLCGKQGIYTYDGEL